MLCPTVQFVPTGGVKWIDSKNLDLNKYNQNSSKCYVLEDDLNYPKELLELLVHYPLAPDKIEIKREIEIIDCCFL